MSIRIRRVAALLALNILFTACASEDSGEPTLTGVNALVAPSGATIKTVILQPQNGSRISGTVHLFDDGTELRILGRGRHFNDRKVYASLIYDQESEPSGPLACEPGIFDPTHPGYILPTMFINLWQVNGDLGRLQAENIVDENSGLRVYVPLRLTRTVSIRDLTINGGFGPEAVAACGEVVR